MLPTIPLFREEPRPPLTPQIAEASLYYEKSYTRRLEPSISRVVRHYHSIKWNLSVLSSSLANMIHFLIYIQRYQYHLSPFI